MDNKWKKTLKFVEYMAPAGTPSVSHDLYNKSPSNKFTFCQCGFVTITYSSVNCKSK